MMQVRRSRSWKTVYKLGREGGTAKFHRHMYNTHIYYLYIYIPIRKCTSSVLLNYFKTSNSENIFFWSTSWYFGSKCTLYFDLGSSSWYFGSKSILYFDTGSILWYFESKSILYFDTGGTLWYFESKSTLYLDTGSTSWYTKHGVFNILRLIINFIVKSWYYIHGRPQGGICLPLEISRYIYFNINRKKLPTISTMHYA